MRGILLVVLVVVSPQCYCQKCNPDFENDYTLVHDSKKIEYYKNSLEWTLSKIKNRSWNVLDLGGSLGTLARLAARSGASQVFTFETEDRINFFEPKVPASISCISSSIKDSSPPPFLRLDAVLHSVPTQGTLNLNSLKELGNALRLAHPATMIIPHRTVGRVQALSAPSLRRRFPTNGRQTTKRMIPANPACLQGPPPFSPPVQAEDTEDGSWTYNLESVEHAWMAVRERPLRRQLQHMPGLLLLTSSVIVAEVDLSRPWAFIANGSTAELLVTASGCLDGLALWWDLSFPGGGNLSAGPDPSLPPGRLPTTSSHQVFLLDKPFPVNAGDVINFTFDWTDELQVRQVNRRPGTAAHPDHPPLEALVGRGDMTSLTLKLGWAGDCLPRYSSRPPRRLGMGLGADLLRRAWDWFQEGKEEAANALLVQAKGNLRGEAAAHALAAHILAGAGRDGDAAAQARAAAAAAAAKQDRASEGQGADEWGDETDVALALMEAAGRVRNSSAASAILQAAGSLSIPTTCLKACLLMSAGEVLLLEVNISNFDVSSRRKLDALIRAESLVRQALDVIGSAEDSSEQDCHRKGASEMSWSSLCWLTSPSPELRSEMESHRSFRHFRVFSSGPAEAQRPAEPPSTCSDASIFPETSAVGDSMTLWQKRLGDLASSVGDEAWRRAIRKAIFFSLEEARRQAGTGRPIEVVEAGDGLGLFALEAAWAGAEIVRVWPATDRAQLLTLDSLQSNLPTSDVRLGWCKGWREQILSGDGTGEGFECKGQADVVLLSLAGMGTPLVLEPQSLLAASLQVQVLSRRSCGDWSRHQSLDWEAHCGQVVPQSLGVFVQVVHAPLAAARCVVPFNYSLGLAGAAKLEFPHSQVPMTPLTPRVRAWVWDLRRPMGAPGRPVEVELWAADGGQAHAVAVSHSLGLPGGGRLRGDAWAERVDGSRLAFVLPRARRVRRGERLVVRVAMTAGGLAVDLLGEGET